MGEEMGDCDLCGDLEWELWMVDGATWRKVAVGIEDLWICLACFIERAQAIGSTVRIDGFWLPGRDASRSKHFRANPIEIKSGVQIVFDLIYPPFEESVLTSMHKLKEQLFLEPMLLDFDGLGGPEIARVYIQEIRIITVGDDGQLYRPGCRQPLSSDEVQELRLVRPDDLGPVGLYPEDGRE